jgi:hypothetical protein
MVPPLSIAVLYQFLVWTCGLNSGVRLSFKMFITMLADICAVLLTLTTLTTKYLNNTVVDICELYVHFDAQEIFQILVS